MIYKTHCQSPLGKLTLASDGSALVGLWIEGQKNFGGNILQGAEELAELAVFNETKRWIYGYFAGKCPNVKNIPIAPAGNDFRQAVWTALSEIPYGEVATYNEIADRVAALTGKDKMAAQAVGGAIGHNPISIIIPCHRVIGRDGSLTGYAAGVEKKAMLLRLEGVRRTYAAKEKTESDTERILSLSGTKLDFSI